VALKVLFETNSDSILPQYYSNLNELGKVLAQPQYATYRIQIQGHTDSVGSARYNQLLSQKRAESVKQYLLQHFPIKPGNLTVAGYGKSDPIAPNETPEGRNKNRRVQVVNLGE
jgi:outer membrane protein OmpA-like peptidoglycan-associated protein